MASPSPSSAAGQQQQQQQQQQHKRKRISYVLPPANHALDLLQLPPALPSEHIAFDSRPRLYSARTGRRLPDAAQYASDLNSSTNHDAPTNNAFQTHPKHCLGVSSLAIDLSTAVMPSDGGDTYFTSNDPTPQGILYSAGRDGLVAAWELKLPTRKRQRRIGSERKAVTARNDRWMDLGIYESEEDVDHADDGGDDEGSSDNSSDEAPSLHEDDKDPFADYSPGQSKARNPTRQRKQPKNNLPFEDKWMFDGSARDVPLGKTTFRQSVHSHSDWINSLVLCNMNQTVVTASSDQTIKAWNPHHPSESMQPALVGTHDDYVRCLANSRHGGWIASGAFDRCIKVWDLVELRDAPLVEFGPTSDVASVYALATNQQGHLIASGSPEKMIRLWDPRSNKPQVSRLNGHADNVRSILMSEDGKCLLTASADSTIKLWSLAMQRCVHTFTYHNDSVWTLFSTHPYLDTFYSGDKTGIVCKVDTEGCGDLSEGQCVVLCKDDESSAASNAKYGRADGINAIVAVDDAYVWTATGASSIQRWKDVPPLSGRYTTGRSLFGKVGGEARSPTEGLPLLPENDVNDSPTGSPLLPTAATSNAPPSFGDRRGVSFATASTNSSSTASPTSGIFGHRAQRPSINARSSALRSTSGTASHQTSMSTTNKVSEDLKHGVPLESLVPLGLPDDVGGSMFGRVDSRLHANGSLTSLPNAAGPSTPGRIGASFGFPGSSLSRFPSNRTTDTAHNGDDMPKSASYLSYEDRESCLDAVPLRMTPDDVLYGRKGLIRCAQLNDRRTVLTVDTTGDIAVWDIVLCRCIGVFARDDLLKQHRAQCGEMHYPQGKEIRALLEFVQERVEGTGVALQWAAVDVRVGSLSVHLDEGRCFNGETYVEDSGFDALFSSEVIRLNYAKIILRNLFDAFIQAELRKGLPSNASPAMASSTNTSPTGTDFLRMHRTQAPGHISLQGLNRQSSGATRPLATNSIALATPALTSALPPNETDKASRIVDRSLSILYQVKETAEEPVPSTATTPKAAPEPLKTPMTNRTNASPMTPGSNGFMNRFKLRSRTKTTEQTPAAEATEASPAQTLDQSPKAAHRRFLTELFSTPIQPPTAEDAPRLRLPPGVVYAIAEETKVSGAYSVMHRGLADNTGLEASTLEEKSPAWLLEFLLQNRFPPAEAQKLTFVLTPWKNENGEASMPVMPLNHSRLTANRLLRIAKVSAFIADKLNIQHAQQQQNLSSPKLNGNPLTATLVQRSPQQQQPSPSSVGPPSAANEGGDDKANLFDPARVELICNEVALPPQATLAAVKHVCFRKGGDLGLLYRLREAEE